MGIVVGVLESGFFGVIILTLGVVAVVAAVLALRHEARRSRLAEDLRKALRENILLREKVKSLEIKTGQLNQEISLKEQMYNGLKEQYEELEKDFEKMSR